MNVDAELILLRDFYDKWLAYHSMSDAKPHQRKEAGQLIIDAHNAIQRLSEPTESARILRLN